MAVRKLRAGVFGGLAMLGAGVMLSACSPVQMGAAAIVGNQRISQATLSANVTDLQSAMAKVPAQQLQITSAQAPKASLTLLLQFAVWNRAAKDAGVTVTQAQVDQAVDGIKQAEKQNPAQVIDYAITDRTLQDYARLEVQQSVMIAKVNGGKAPSSQADQTKVQAALGKIENRAVKELNIKVNPQYGKFDPQQGIVATPDLLSKSASSAAQGAAPASS